MQENIIRVLTAKIDQRADQIDMAVKQNTLQIEGLKKSLDNCYQDIADLKKESACLKTVRGISKKDSRNGTEAE